MLWNKFGLEIEKYSSNQMINKNMWPKSFAKKKGWTYSLKYTERE